MIAIRPIEGFSFIDKFFSDFFEKLNEFKTFLPGNINLIDKRYQDQLDKLEEEQNKYDTEFEEFYEKAIKLGLPNEKANEIAEQEYGGYGFEKIKQNYLDFYLRAKEFTIDSTLKSNILLLYSLLESSLVDLVDILINRNSTSLNLDDIKGSNYLNQTIVFLEKVFNYNLNKKILDKIIKFQKIRNSIVHENSYIKSKLITQTLRQYSDFVNIKDEKFYFKDKEIVYIFIQLLKDFFKSLEIELEQKYNFPSLNKKYDYYLFSNLIEKKGSPDIYINDKIITYKIKTRFKEIEFNLEITYTKKKADNNLYLEINRDLL